MYRDREKYILEVLLRDKEVSVKELAKTMYASEQSIRRDLQKLEKEGLVKRVHGGAILEESDASKIKIPFLIREFAYYNEKTIIAKKAAELVNDGNVIFIDGSSSAYNMIPFLTTKNDLTIITNGVQTLMRANEYGINAYSTGGHLLPSSIALVGEEAYSIIETFNADICFFATRGMTTDGIMTDFCIEETLIRRKMLKQSNTKVYLCYNEKIGTKYMYNVCRAEDVDYIISELPLPPSLSKYEL